MSKQLHTKKFICKILTCWMPHTKRILFREALYWFSLSDYLKFRQADYHIVSLGCNCLPRGLTTAIKIKPRRFYGEKSCPFDFCNQPDLNKNIKLIENDFADFFKNLEINNTTFPHDYKLPYEKFVKRYQNRIQNFQYNMKSDKKLYFIYANYEKIPSKNEIIKLYNVLKVKRNNKPFKLIILTYEYIDGLQDIIQIPVKFVIDNPAWLVYMIDEYKEYSNKYTQYKKIMKNELEKIII